MKTQELRQIIREEISNVINENLTITDWDEFANPDYVLLKLSNGKKLEIHAKRITGGKAAYKLILSALDTMKTNPKAEKFILTLINKMA